MISARFPTKTAFADYRKLLRFRTISFACFSFTTRERLYFKIPIIKRDILTKVKPKNTLENIMQ